MYCESTWSNSRPLSSMSRKSLLNITGYQFYGKLKFKMYSSLLNILCKFKSACLQRLGLPDNPVSTWQPIIYLTALYLPAYPSSTWEENPVSTRQPFIYLATLYLSGNPVSIWQPCIYLETLYLSGNPVSTWQPCNNLANLYLSGNPVSAWQPCIYLATLYLPENPVSTR